MVDGVVVLGGASRDDVGVVTAGDGHERLRALDAGLLQRRPVEHDAGQGAAAEVPGQAPEGGRVLVDDHDVVVVAVEGGGQPGTDPPATGDDHMHRWLHDDDML